MASIVKETRGGVVQWRVFFRDKNGQRKTIRLGRGLNKRAASEILRRVEALNIAAIAGSPPDDQTARWLADRGDALRRKLARAGLVPAVAAVPDEAPAATLGSFLDSYISGRANLKPNTARNYHQTRKHLVAYFGSGKPLSDITQGDADAWRESMIGKGLSAATVSREVKRARQFFRAAVRKRLLAENPFSDLPSPQQVNRARDFFVTRDMTTKVLDACPDAEWRLLVALARFGGVRTPSESVALQWADVDWAEEKVTIRSPKTEHHPNGATRTIPLFPELRPFLDAVFHAAPPGTSYAVTRYRDANANLRTQFERIIRRAGLEPWPKLWHNLRASRQTELTQQFPLHVVCAWIGNSQPVAAKHYLQVTDADFARAVEPAPGYPSPPALPPTAGEKNGCNRWVRVGSEDGCKGWDTQDSADSRHDNTTGRKPQDNKDLRPVVAGCGQSWPEDAVPPRGVEPLSSD